MLGVVVKQLPGLCGHDMMDSATTTTTQNKPDGNHVKLRGDDQMRNGRDPHDVITGRNNQHHKRNSGNSGWSGPCLRRLGGSLTAFKTLVSGPTVELRQSKPTNKTTGPSPATQDTPAADASACFVCPFSAQACPVSTRLTPKPRRDPFRSSSFYRRPPGSTSRESLRPLEIGRHCASGE